MKNCLEINSERKKIAFCQAFHSLQILLELQCLVDDLVDFLELSMFINASLSYIYYLMNGIGDSDMKKKAFC